MIAPADYQMLARLLRQHSGLALSEGKEYLVESRLTPLAAAHGLPNLAALLARLRTQPDAALLRQVSEAMATHESLFFRDGTPFQLLRDEVLPALLKARRAQRRLRLWSAGTSTGQEAYSLAMTVAESWPLLSGWQVEILATDYSEAAIARARRGVYNHFEVQRGLSLQHRAQYFTPADGAWRVRDELRAMIDFRTGNLLEPFGALGSFDVVFCRNVLIYFDVATKADVLDRLSRVLAPDGFLFLGSTETCTGICPRLLRAGTGTAPMYRPLASAADRLAG